MASESGSLYKKGPSDFQNALEIDDALFFSHLYWNSGKSVEMEDTVVDEESAIDCYLVRRGT